MSETPPERKRWSWLKREAIDLGDAAVQIFAVVVGILLALFINDWSTHRQQQTTINEALHAISSELAHNQTQMHKHYVHLHDMAIAMRKEARATDAPRQCTAYGAFHGMGGVPVLLNAAYQTAIATQALAEMPFAQAQDIERIYGYQQAEQKLEDSDSSFVFAQHAIPENDCAGIISEMADNAREIDKGYSTFIKLIAAPAARH